MRKTKHVSVLTVLSDGHFAEGVISRQPLFGELVKQDYLEIFIRLYFSIIGDLNLDLAGFFVRFNCNQLVDSLIVNWRFGSSIPSLNKKRIINVDVFDDGNLAVSLSLADRIMQIFEANIRILLKKCSTFALWLVDIQGDEASSCFIDVSNSLTIPDAFSRKGWL